MIRQSITGVTIHPIIKVSAASDELLSSVGRMTSEYGKIGSNQNQIARFLNMDRPCDTQAGMKHRCTASALRYLRSEVMEMCQRENLYQIDLLNGSKKALNLRRHWMPLLQKRMMP